LLFKFLTSELGLDGKGVAESLWRDWQRGGRANKPEFLRPWIGDAGSCLIPRSRVSTLKRQSRHIAASG
jgi:hypothetical protein